MHWLNRSQASLEFRDHEIEARSLESDLRDSPRSKTGPQPASSAHHAGECEASRVSGLIRLRKCRRWVIIRAIILKKEPRNEKGLGSTVSRGIRATG